VDGTLPRVDALLLEALFCELLMMRGKCLSKKLCAQYQGPCQMMSVG
jgi:hypothetical protein